jgi:6-phosphogluconate dehydrogenase (decarboxylating)
MLGLGGMGADIVKRLMRDGHECVVAAEVGEGVPAHVLTAALYGRFNSRGETDFADKVLSAMRSELGGHAEHPAAAA